VIRAVGGARDADAFRVRPVPPRAGSGLGPAVVPVPRDRAPARQPGSGHPSGAPPRPGAARMARPPVARAQPVRRIPAPPRAPRDGDPARAGRARLVTAVPAPRRRRRCVQGDLRCARAALGRVRHVREAGRRRGKLPALALPPREDGRARHRLQARHRRHRRSGVPEEDARGRALSRADRGPHVDWQRMIDIGAAALNEALIAQSIRPLFSRALASGRPIYLANHSLGRPPDRVVEDVQRALDAWYRDMGEAWDEWLAARDRFRALTAQLVGAPSGDSVIPKTSAGQGLRAVLNLFDAPIRVLSTDSEFDSIDFIL